MTATKIIFSLLFLCTLSYCIWRDIQLEKQYPGDLRNRVVGSRLQKDGKLPYFYKWKSEDGIRYYDPQNFDSLNVSNMTATPFLHQLMTPLAGQSQRSISRTWLILEYIFFFITALLALLVAQNNIQRWAIIGTTILFMLTAGWQAHIAAGQYYIIIPALFMLFYYFTSRKKHITHALITGLLAACIILIRPNAAPFFLPFLLIWFRFPLKYKLVFSAAVLLLIGLTFGNSQNRELWKDYRAAMEFQVKAHKGEPVVQTNTPDPHFIEWEGWDKRQIEIDGEAHVFHFEPNHGNISLQIKRVLGIDLPVSLYIIISLLFMLTIIFLFYKRKVKTNDISLFAITLIGFSFYMISDLSAPFYRYQYNAVQWIFPLVLVASHFHKRYKYIYTLLLVGLLLNIIEIWSTPFEHAAGEYLILTGLLWLAFVYNPESQAKNSYIRSHA